MVAKWDCIFEFVWRKEKIVIRNRFASLERFFFNKKFYCLEILRKSMLGFVGLSLIDSFYWHFSFKRPMEAALADKKEKNIVSQEQLEGIFFNVEGIFVLFS